MRNIQNINRVPNWEYFRCFVYFVHTQYASGTRYVCLMHYTAEKWPGIEASILSLSRLRSSANVLYLFYFCCWFDSKKKEAIPPKNRTKKKRTVHSLIVVSLCPKKTADSTYKLDWVYAHEKVVVFGMNSMGHKSEMSRWGNYIASDRIMVSIPLFIYLFFAHLFHFGCTDRKMDFHLNQNTNIAHI